MNNLYFKKTDVLPGVFFDSENGKLEISGQSCPTNADIFFQPLMKWLDDYIKTPCETTLLELNLNYFNTMSAKNILMIMKKTEELSQIGKQIKIRWLYDKEDDDLLEAGSDFEAIVNVPFEIVAVEKE